MKSTPDPSVLAWLDQEDRRTAQTIRRHGVAIEYIGGDDCERCRQLGTQPPAHEPHSTPFGYTIGLFGIGHPELVIVGADPSTTAAVLNDLTARIRAGDDLTPGEVLEFDGWSHRVTVEVVPNPGEIAFSANRFYQRPDEASVQLFQLTYDDTRGRFPGDDGYANPAWVQPRPGQWRA